MAVTPKGIYYPTGDDAANWATIFQTMANSIDSALGDFTYDSGWINFTNFQNGWSSGFSGDLNRAQYRRSGKIVQFVGTIRNSSGAVAGVVHNMPTAFKNRKSYYFLAPVGYTEARRLEMNSSGNLNCPSSGFAGHVSLGNIKYVVG